MTEKKAPLYMFVSARTQTVGGLTGMRLAFEAGVAIHVPKPMHAVVMEKGIMPCDAEGKILEHPQAIEPEDGDKIRVAPGSAEEREEKILEVFKALIKANDPTSFTGGGVPNATAVTMALGWKTDPKEVRQVWVKHKPDLMKKE